MADAVSSALRAVFSIPKTDGVFRIRSMPADNRFVSFPHSFCRCRGSAGALARRDMLPAGLTLCCTAVLSRCSCSPDIPLPMLMLSLRWCCSLIARSCLFHCAAYVFKKGASGADAQQEMRNLVATGMRCGSIMFLCRSVSAQIGATARRSAFLLCMPVSCLSRIVGDSFPSLHQPFSTHCDLSRYRDRQGRQALDVGRARLSEQGASFCPPGRASEASPLCTISVCADPLLSLVDPLLSLVRTPQT